MRTVHLVDHKKWPWPNKDDTPTLCGAAVKFHKFEETWRWGSL